MNDRPPVATIPPAAAANAPSTAAAATTPGEAMTFTELEKRHFEKLVRMKAASEFQFKKTCQTAYTAATAVAAETNAKAQELHHGAKRLEGDLKELAHQTEVTHKRVQEWAGLLVKFNAALKELGDVHNWATMIDRDIEDTVRVLDAVALAKRRAAGLSPVAAAPS